MTLTPITCTESDQLRHAATGVSSSLTTSLPARGDRPGEILNPMLPPHTATTWHNNGVDTLREIVNADGCHHWRINPPRLADPNE